MFDVGIRSGLMQSAETTHGGMRFHGAIRGRSFHAVARRVPGRLVYTRDIGGVRVATGWSGIDRPEDLTRKLRSLLLWAGSSRDRP